MTSNLQNIKRPIVPISLNNKAKLPNINAVKVPEWNGVDIRTSFLSPSPVHDLIRIPAETSQGFLAVLPLPQAVVGVGVSTGKEPFTHEHVGKLSCKSLSAICDIKFCTLFRIDLTVTRNEPM